MSTLKPLNESRLAILGMHPRLNWGCRAKTSAAREPDLPTFLCNIALLSDVRRPALHLLPRPSGPRGRGSGRQAQRPPLPRVAVDREPLPAHRDQRPVHGHRVPMWKPPPPPRNSAFPGNTAPSNAHDPCDWSAGVEGARMKPQSRRGRVGLGRCGLCTSYSLPAFGAEFLKPSYGQTKHKGPAAAPKQLSSTSFPRSKWPTRMPDETPLHSLRLCAVVPAGRWRGCMLLTCGVVRCAAWYRRRVYRTSPPPELR